MTRFLVAAAVLASICTGSRADDRKNNDKVVLDRQFLIKTATCAHAEVMYSELAEKRASSGKVKDLAAKIVKDHRRINEDLTLLAEKQKLAILAGTEQKTKDETKRLSKLEGAEFDRAYLKRIIADHEKGVRMFENQAKDGRDESLTAFAKKNLPRIKAHLKEARALADARTDK
jgi:putative membrane protein